MALVEITVLDKRMRMLALASVHLERLDSSSIWAEGPVYFPAGDYLLWSDIPNNRLMQWVPELGTRVFSHQANNSNGNTCDPMGRRISCEHLTRSVVRFEADGSRSVLASSHAGKPLNSPNDVVVTGDGAVWFTDPSYGIMSDHEGRRADVEQDGCFVYRIDPATGDVQAKVRSMLKPNGLAFSPDETVLYVADSSYSHDDAGFHHVKAFDVGPGGSLHNERVFATINEGVPDGLRIDEFGNAWISSARGVEVFAPDGTPLGIIHVPETVSNLTFGGPKNNRLFITATTSLYSVFTAVRGAQRPAAK
ncbi:MAG: SMP-30/gluconolactonase/LRE family protein [Devosia sp.]